MDIETYLRAHGGAARWRSLDDAGFSRGELLRAVRIGSVVRPHRGCYAMRGTSRETVLATIFRAVPTCVTWCEIAGLPVETAPCTTHLALPVSRGLGMARERPDAVVTRHRVGLFPADAAFAHLDIAASCTSPLQQVALLDAALGRGFLAAHEIQGMAFGSEARRLWVRGHVNAGSQSLGETYARVALVEAGVSVQAQARIGDVGAVDLLVEGRVVVEIDGFRFHTGHQQFGRDRDRDRALTLLGFTPLRFTHHDVVERLDDVVADVIATVWRVGLDSPTVRTRLTRAARDSRPMWWR